MEPGRRRRRRSVGVHAAARGRASAAANAVVGLHARTGAAETAGGACAVACRYMADMEEVSCLGGTFEARTFEARTFEARTFEARTGRARVACQSMQRQIWDARPGVPPTLATDDALRHRRWARVRPTDAHFIRNPMVCLLLCKPWVLLRSLSLSTHIAPLPSNQSFAPL
eukprot:365920-Chlamydomonas_euryale.AAC.26